MVLQEVVLDLVRCGVLADRDSMVSQHLGCLLNVRLEQHYWEGQGKGEQADAGYNEEVWMVEPLEMGVGMYGACT